MHTQRDLGQLGSQNAGSMDLRCLSRWQGNPYHDLIDCLMPIVPALHLLDAVGGQACFSSNQPFHEMDLRACAARAQECKQV